MAFKSKINPVTLAELTHKEYEKQIKKEVAKAEKFGSLPVIVLSHFKFACGTISTLMLFGKQSGELGKFYKRAKKERKQENDFAKGICYFEATEDQGTILHIALNDGKGKPSQMKKNSKALFKKLGMSPNIYKGELPEDLLAGSQAALSVSEVELLDKEADEENDKKSLAWAAKQYQKYFKMVTLELLPMLKTTDAVTFEVYHLKLAKKGYQAASGFLDRYEEEDKEKHLQKYAPLRDKVLANKDQLQKIAAKIKQLLSQQAEQHIGESISSEELEQEGKIILEEMQTKFQAAFDWLDQLQTPA